MDNHFLIIDGISRSYVEVAETLRVNISLMDDLRQPKIFSSEREKKMMSLAIPIKKQAAPYSS